METLNNMKKEKAKQLLRILENFLLKGELGLLKKYTFSDKIQTENKIEELKKIINDQT